MTNNIESRSVRNIALNVYKGLADLAKSNEEIAFDLDVSVRTIYNYMNGSRIPDVKMLIKLASYLGKKVDDLLV